MQIELDDQQLATQAQAGDRDSLNTLLSRNYQRVFMLCRRMANSEADAHDYCQDALVSIVKGLPRFDGRSSFSTWSYRVATNACLDAIRRNKRVPMPVDQLTVAQTVETQSDGVTIAGDVVDKMFIDEILPAVDDAFRVPLVMREVTGLSYNEIAETLDIPIGTVRSRISRGRKQLSELLGNQKGMNAV